jgi:hypothetical protein
MKEIFVQADDFKEIDELEFQKSPPPEGGIDLESPVSHNPSVPNQPTQGHQVMSDSYYEHSTTSVPSKNTKTPEDTYDNRGRRTSVVIQSEIHEPKIDDFCYAFRLNNIKTNWYAVEHHVMLNIIHSSTLGYNPECYDHEEAARICETSRETDPEGQEWLRAQIAFYLAWKLDPNTRWEAEIWDDPGLAQTAILPDVRLWPEPTILNLSDWRRVDFTDAQRLFVSLQAFYYEQHKTVQIEMLSSIRADWCWASLESCSAAIRAIISLFGQTGFDQLLAFEKVQEILRPLAESALGVCGPLLSSDEVVTISRITSSLRAVEGIVHNLPGEGPREPLTWNPWMFNLRDNLIKIDKSHVTLMSIDEPDIFPVRLPVEKVESCAREFEKFPGLLYRN